MSNKFVLLISLFLIIINSSSANVQIDQFFLFGRNVSDKSLKETVVGGNLDDGSSPPVPLSRSFQFFNKGYSQLWVNINGGVSFNAPIATYTPLCTPLTQAMSMIAPFWADVDLRTSPLGNIYYRETTDNAVLSKALTDVKTAFPTLPNLTELRWGFVATWHEVGFYQEDLTYTSKSNTFQMALVTDGVYSFVIFNYNKITWTTGTASNGNKDGLGGMPARAGFDNGEGKLTLLPGSCTADIVNITTQRMANGPGKFVFRVEGDRIIVSGSSTLRDVTDNVTRPTVTQPFTQTSPSTIPPTTISEEQIEFHKHHERTEHRLRDIRVRLLTDCDRLIERPALEKECYHELEKLNNLFHELTLTKYMDELERVEREMEKISLVLDRIEKDISYFFY